MTIEYGVTSQGFVIKTLSEIKSEIESNLIDSFGKQINLTPESMFGQLRDIYAEREHELWELAQLIYNSQYPQTASGVSLENILDFSALEKLSARTSIITEQALFGTASTVITSGTQIAVENDPTTVFSTDEDVTLVAGADEIQNIAFDISPTSGTFTLKYNSEETTSLNYNASNVDIQDALNNLSSLSGIYVVGSIAADFVVTFLQDDSKQPHPLLTVGTNSLSPATVITITETTPGEYQGTVSMTCTETGAKNANAKSLTVINTPISGFDRTFNIDDATLGRDEETDAEARIRRNTNIVTSRTATVEAIRTKISDLNGDDYSDLPEITDIIVYENDTDSTDSKNMPPHSIMAVVRQFGDVDTRDQEIAQAIFDSKAAGIATSYGYATGGDAVSKTITDSMEIDHTINFARPSSVDIYLGLYNFSKNSEYPDDGDDQLKTILAAWGNTLGVGQDVIVYPQLIAQINEIPGILDFTVRIDTSAISGTSTDDNINISDGTSTTPEYSNWSTINITITTDPPPV